jgi:hypothetical protein
MKKMLFAVMSVLLLASTGCSTKTGSAAAGALGGAAAGGGVYEYRIQQEMKRVEDDYKAGKMDKKEYDARVDEINRLSLIKK